jgi:hypothetical protein
MYTAYFLSAEIDHLKKIQAAKPMEEKLEEIPRPTKFTSLQDAMGLTENKKLYSFCRVSFHFLPLKYILLIISLVSCSRCYSPFRIIKRCRLEEARRSCDRKGR